LVETIKARHFQDLLHLTVRFSLAATISMTSKKAVAAPTPYMRRS